MKKLFGAAIAGLLFCSSLGMAARTTEARDSNREIQQTSRPCRERSENSQFDFWVGEWDVTSDGRIVGSSRIEKIAEGCIIFENYQQGLYSGKSLNFYDWHLKKWRQSWVDSLGTVGEFKGEFREGAMRYEGESHLSDGRRVLRRMTISKLGDDEVRQYSERSDDEGKSWKKAYDFIYKRRK